MKITSVSTTGTRSTLTVNEEVFGGSVNQQLLAQAVRVYTANLHQGTSKVKSRSEINRTKKKWFKQKGTGNARHGARSAPIFVGGGVAHGPKGLRGALLQLSQTQRREALKSALRLQAAAVIVNESLEKLGNKTSAADKSLKKVIEKPGLVLLVTGTRNTDLEQGVRNLSYVRAVTAESITALDICTADTVMFSPDGLEKLTERLSSKSSAKKIIVEKKAAPAKKTETVKKEATPAKAVAPKKKPAAKKATTTAKKK